MFKDYNRFRLEQIQSNQEMAEKTGFRFDFIFYA